MISDIIGLIIVLSVLIFFLVVVWGFVFILLIEVKELLFGKHEEITEAVTEEPRKAKTTKRKSAKTKRRRGRKASPKPLLRPDEPDSTGIANESGDDETSEEEGYENSAVMDEEDEDVDSS